MSWLALLAVLLLMASVPAIMLCPRHHRWRWGAGAALAMLLVVLSAIADDTARKTVQFCLMPTGLAWLASGALATACFMLRQLWMGGLLVGLFLLQMAGGNQWLGAHLIASLERRVDVQAVASDERYDVVCVLGGGTSRRYDGMPQLSLTGDRWRVGALMYRQQRTPLLLTTGIFAPDARLMWTHLGIPGEQILMDRGTDNTGEEIALIKRLATERGWKQIGVVSSAWHLPRVARLAARQELGILPLPSDWLGAIPWWTGETLVPKSEGMRLVELGLKEHLGLLLGR